jgi:hypothetical protein
MTETMIGSVTLGILAEDWQRSLTLVGEARKVHPSAATPTSGFGAGLQAKSDAS